jgi:hypothetical protein
MIGDIQKQPLCAAPTEMTLNSAVCKKASRFAASEFELCHPVKLKIEYGLTKNANA